MRLSTKAVFSVIFMGVSSHGATSLSLDQGKSEIEFLAIGRPSAIKIHGHTDESKLSSGKALAGAFIVEGTNLSGKATYRLDALVTGIEMRDRHMKEKYLETAKYPVAALTLTKLLLPEGFGVKEISKEGVPFEGTLLLHGVSHPVTGEVSLKSSSAEADLDFTFPIKLSEFAIAIPNYLGITVAEEVKVTAKAHAPLGAKSPAI